MAKRKRKPGRGKGFKLRLDKDYRSDQYIPYIMNVETGILEAATIDPGLTDGDVKQTIESLISRLKEPETLPQLLPGESTDTPTLPPEGEGSYVQALIMMNLQRAFNENGPLEVEDVIGILKVINHSLSKWNIGLHKRGYLDYLQDFLGEVGVNVQKLSLPEVKALDLDKPESGSD
jgi:hypothetical protein